MRGGRVARALLALAVAAWPPAAAQPAAARHPGPVHGRPSAATDSTVPVLSIGEGGTFAQALAAAVRMAVEAGAGAAVRASITAQGEHVVADTLRAVTRGVVQGYVVVDSARTPAGMRVRILARVSRISEREPVAAPGRSVTVPGALWAATATLDSARAAAEARLLGEIFGALDGQPSAYAYDVETGPPLPSGNRMRLRLRIVRSPGEAYGALAEHAAAVLAAVAGPAGHRVERLPASAEDTTWVQACVSACGSLERRVLDVRAALAATDSLGAFDPPVLAREAPAAVPTLFPDLRTAGGFVVRFADSTAGRAQRTHVRSTRGFLLVADYLRTTFDDARLRVRVGERTIDLLESFRSPWSGAPEHRFATTTPAGASAVTLVRGFRPRTSGGPGAPTTLGSPYVVLTVPGGADIARDTAVVDVWLTPGEAGSLTAIRVEPLATTRRLGALSCRVARVRWPNGVVRDATRCNRPESSDTAWRSLGDEARRSPAVAAGNAKPAVATGNDSPEAVPQPTVPPAVRDALDRPPLRDGDGAIFLPAGGASSAVAVGTATVDPLAPAQACAVARLRAQRELLRLLVGSKLESRTAVSTTEQRGGAVSETFREDISERVAGRLVGASLAAQWSLAAPGRCRVALWLADGLAVHPRASRGALEPPG